MFPPVSIVIPVKSNNHFLEECVSHCLKLDYPFFEIIILPDDMMGAYADKHIKIVPTGETLPATKRDIGCDNTSGQIIAFLDDDTYPSREWLKHAVVHFKDPDIACVCGPAITPESEPLLNRASGKIFESIAVSGPARFRYLPLKQRLTDDFPSCNFLIRKNLFQKVGGFQTKFWPGEDTILCSEIVHSLGKRIIYDPLVKVFHHRRSIYGPHLKQIRNYALHRGYFVKRFPKTSFRLGYFLPTMIIFINVFSIAMGLFQDYRWFTLPLIYIVLIALCSVNSNILLSWHVLWGSVASHLVYGVYFLKGLFSGKLKEE